MRVHGLRGLRASRSLACQALLAKSPRILPIDCSVTRRAGSGPLMNKPLSQYRIRDPNFRDPYDRGEVLARGLHESVNSGLAFSPRGKILHSPSGASELLKVYRVSGPRLRVWERKASGALREATKTHAKQQGGLVPILPGVVSVFKHVAYSRSRCIFNPNGLACWNGLMVCRDVFTRCNIESPTYTKPHQKPYDVNTEITSV